MIHILQQLLLEEPGTVKSWKFEYFSVGTILEERKIGSGFHPRTA